MAQKLEVRYVRYYTQGSAAQNIVPAFPVTKAPQPRVRKVKWLKIFVDPVAILGIVVAVAMLIMMGTGVARLRSAQEETVRLEAYVDQLTKTNDRLQAQYKESYNLLEVEYTALAMGMIPKDQAPRVTIDVSVPVQQEQVTLWEQIGTFLTGLFA